MKRKAVLFVLLGGGCVGTWLLFLGWHRPEHLDAATSTLSGPATPATAAGAIAVVAVLALLGGALAGRAVTAAAMTPTLTVLFAAEAASSPYDDGLWPVGAVLVAIGSLIGTLLVAGLGARYAARRAERLTS